MLNFFSNLWPGAARSPVALVPAIPADLAIEPPPPYADNFRQIAGKLPECRPRQVSQTDMLLRVLIDAREPLSITELGRRMGVTAGEASKRVKAAGKAVKVRREGRYKMVRNEALTWPEFQRLRALPL